MVEVAEVGMRVIPSVDAFVEDLALNLAFLSKLKDQIVLNDEAPSIHKFIKLLLKIKYNK